jgi:hypothetical protein
VMASIVPHRASVVCAVVHILFPRRRTVTPQPSARIVAFERLASS